MGRKKVYGELIEGKEKTKSQNRIESNSAKKKKKKNRKEMDYKQLPDNNWDTFKLSNIPDKVTMKQLRRALRVRDISGQLNIENLGEGFGYVTAENGLQLKALKGFLMEGQHVKIDLVEGALSAIQETESNPRQLSLPNPEKTDSDVVDGVSIEEISKHDDGAKKTDRKKVYGELIEGKKKTKS